MAATKTKQVSGWKLLWRLMRYQPKLYVIDSIFWILIMGLPAVRGIIREFFNTLTGESQLCLDHSLLLPTAWGKLLSYLVALPKVSCALPSVH